MKNKLNMIVQKKLNKEHLLTIRMDKNMIRDVKHFCRVNSINPGIFYRNLTIAFFKEVQAKE